MNAVNRLQVGIDVSRDWLDLALLRPEGDALEGHRRFANSGAGYQQVRELLVQVLEEHGFAGVDIAAEATSYYWLPAFIRLHQDQVLSEHALKLYLLNARWVKWHKQSLSPDNKDDATDPQYIADRIRMRKPSREWHYEPRWLSLRLLTRLHVHLSRSIVREKNLFQLYLFLMYPTYARRKPFRDSLGRTSQKLLAQPERLAALAQLPLPELAEQLYELSGHHLPQPEKNATALQQVLQESYGLLEEIAPTIQFVLERLLKVIEHLHEDLQQVDQQIQALVATGDYPEVAWLDSIVGLSLVLAAGIAAEIGGLERFASVLKWDKQRKVQRPRRVKEIEDAVGKFAGLWWPKNASGNYTAEERRLSKAGDSYLRYYVLQAADGMRQHIPSYSAYYAKKYGEVPKHRHARARVLTGRKALGLFVSLLYHQEVYRAEEAA